MEILLYAAAALLVLVGLIGTVAPALPGAALVFLGLLAAAWIDGFARVGVWTLAVVAALMLLSYVADAVAGAVGAERFGATRRAAWGAALGTLVGLFFGLPGLVLGPFLGAVAGELTARRRLREASRAGVGAWVGIVVGGVVRIGLVFAMIGVFLAAWWT